MILSSTLFEPAIFISRQNIKIAPYYVSEYWHVILLIFFSLSFFFLFVSFYVRKTPHYSCLLSNVGVVTRGSNSSEHPAISLALNEYLSLNFRKSTFSLSLFPFLQSHYSRVFLFLRFLIAIKKLCRNLEMSLGLSWVSLNIYL